MVGTLDTLDASQTFDCLLYIDVLEHIADDAGEVRRAAGRLEPGGSLVILCPAHQFLFSDFDHAIGHYRRYNAAMMAALARDAPVGADLLSRQRRNPPVDLEPPAPWQSNALQVADSCLGPRFIPISRVLDPLFGYRLGKAVIGIWTKRGNQGERRSDSQRS